jgi:formate dehydrogenase major subunit
MDLTRRSVLKILGASTALGTLGKPRAGWSLPLPERIKEGKETTTICPYCAVGCGIIVTASNGKVRNTEGDPDHPINQGALCSKGAALSRIHENPYRLTRVLYRASGSVQWVPKSWNWAIREIAKRVINTREATFQEEEGESIVNRTTSIASFGGACLDNEEAYLWVKLMRSLGLVNIEHQARV